MQPLKVISKIDRTLHRGKYQQVMHNIHEARARARQLKDEIEELQGKLDANKMSPQAASFEAALKDKRAALQNANDHLEMLTDLGRKGLNEDPREYQLNKATKRGALVGGMAGLAAGALGAATATHKIMSENIEYKIDKLLQEADKFNLPLMATMQQNGLIKPPVDAALYGQDAALYKAMDPNATHPGFIAKSLTQQFKPGGHLNGPSNERASFLKAQGDRPSNERDMYLHPNGDNISKVAEGINNDNDNVQSIIDNIINN